MTITQTIPTAVLAALSDPDVCGWHDETGPCDNCTGHAAHQLGSGMTEAEVLADIERARQRGVSLRLATEASEAVPPSACGMSHDEHMAAWKSWRDDCVGPDGCGFAMRDLDQCERGHPDDGVDMCGACGFERDAKEATR